MVARTRHGRDPRRRQLAALHPALQDDQRRDRPDGVDGRAAFWKVPVSSRPQRRGGEVPVPAVVGRTRRRGTERQRLLRHRRRLRLLLGRGLAVPQHLRPPRSHRGARTRLRPRPPRGHRRADGRPADADGHPRGQPRRLPHAHGAAAERRRPAQRLRLHPVEDASLTAIYCYDSMVHFSPDLVESYLLMRPACCARAAWACSTTPTSTPIPTSPARIRTRTG